MSKTRYDAYPYPERDPREETQRLLTGSPSNILEIDHFVFGAKRDWSKRFRVLVAGGGTGDGLIMLAQQLTDFAVPHEITYIDASEKSMRIARKRAQVRKLKHIDFQVGDFTSKSLKGTFDYIDCCGVLHHLLSPLAGLKKLTDLLAEGGGIGGMVYAPLGRTGVYPMQSAFGTLLAGLPHPEQVSKARQILSHLPKTNWVLRNPFVQDHKTSDAGLFDLLLHDQDQPFWSDEVCDLVSEAGLTFAGFVHAVRYDPAHYLPMQQGFAKQVAELSEPKRARLAEELCGSMKTHIFYAVKGTRRQNWRDAENPFLHIMGVPADKLAAHISAGKSVNATFEGNKFTRKLKPSTGKLIAACDGKTAFDDALKCSDLTQLTPQIIGDLNYLADIGAMRASRLSVLSV